MEKCTYSDVVHSVHTTVGMVDPVQCQCCTGFLKQTLEYRNHEKETVGINPILSDLQGPGTSELDLRYLEHHKIDRNELQIGTNSQKRPKNKNG